MPWFGLLSLNEFRLSVSLSGSVVVRFLQCSVHCELLLVLAAACFMVLLFPHATMHTLLSAVQVSPQDNIPVMLFHISRSLEVAFDAMQHSVLVSALPFQLPVP